MLLHKRLSICFILSYVPAIVLALLPTRPAASQFLTYLFSAILIWGIYKYRTYLSNYKILILNFIYSFVMFFIGLLHATTYEEYRSLSIHFVGTFGFLIPFFAIDVESLRKVFRLFITYGVCLCFFIYFFAKGKYGIYDFVHALSPLQVVIIFIPFIKKKKFILFLLGLSIFSIAFDTTIRSNLLNILASYLILILAFINSKKLNRLIACSLIVAPIVLLSLGIMGTFNIFKIEEYDLNITNELTEKSGEDELFIDSRTAVYNNIIGTVYNENALFFGKGYSSKAEYEMDVFGITDQGREGSESGFLNRLLFGGIIAVSLNFLLVLVSIYSGLFKSRNKLSELLAIWLSYKWFFSFIEDPSINGFWVIFFMNMIVVGMLLSKQFRNMNDNDVRFFVNSIFNFKYKYDVYPPIDKRK